MTKIATLSVTIIARNEELDIEECLKSVSGLAGEIVLVDSGSEDKTLEIARKYTDKIFSHEWAGYSAQKQFAMDQAKGPWILNIDADERVTPALAEQIRYAISNSVETGLVAFDIVFHHYFCGTRLRFGGVQGETHVRLFLKDKAAYGRERVHEGIRINGRTGRLTAAIEHQSYRDIRDYLNKCNHYTTLISEKKYMEGRRFNFFHHLRLPFEFVVRYFLRLGFLDGNAGLTYAALSSYYAWLKFVKLRDYERFEKNIGGEKS